MAQPDEKNWHKPFLELLQSMPNIRNALKQVGATREELVEHRAADKRFDLAVDLAMEDGRDNLRMMLTSQAVGAQQPDGTFKGRSERLLTLVARMHLPEFGGGGAPSDGGGGGGGGPQTEMLPLWDAQPSVPARPPSDAELQHAVEEVLASPPGAVEEAPDKEGEVAEELPVVVPEQQVAEVARPAVVEEKVDTTGEIPPLFAEAPPKPPKEPPLQKWQVAALADIRRRFLEAAERVALEDKRTMPETSAVLCHALDVARGQSPVREVEMIIGKISLWCLNEGVSATTKKNAATLGDDARLILKTIVRGGV